MPTSPTRAAQRSPSHCMRPSWWSANTRGMRSSSLSFSVVNRGQSRENEQQAPQLRQSAAASGGVGANLFIPFCQIRPISAMQLAGNLMSWHGGLLSMKNEGHPGDVEQGQGDELTKAIPQSPNARS